MRREKKNEELNILVEVKGDRRGCWPKDFVTRIPWRASVELSDDVCTVPAARYVQVHETPKPTLLPPTPMPHVNAPLPPIHLTIPLSFVVALPLPLHLSIANSTDLVIYQSISSPLSTLSHTPILIPLLPS
jgi:hypothetical protein